MNCRVHLPAQITAGTTFDAVIKSETYLGPLWVASMHMRGPSVIDLTATDVGTDHTFNAAASVTEAWATGQYWVVVRVTDGINVLEIARTEIKIVPDLLSQSAGYDGRSPNELALASINAVIAKRATQDQQKYKINNRELWRTPMADLLKLKSFYQVAVNRERNKMNGVSAFGRKIHVRFKNQ